MPASSTAKPRSEIVTVRLRERDLEAVQLAARQEGIPVSELARTGILSFAGALLNPQMSAQGHPVFNPEARPL